jgi:hypothetical protein
MIGSLKFIRQWVVWHKKALYFKATYKLVQAGSALKACTTCVGSTSPDTHTCADLPYCGTRGSWRKRFGK